MATDAQREEIQELQGPQPEERSMTSNTSNTSAEDYVSADKKSKIYLQNSRLVKIF